MGLLKPTPPTQIMWPNTTKIDGTGEMIAVALMNGYSPQSLKNQGPNGQPAKIITASELDGQLERQNIQENNMRRGRGRPNANLCPREINDLLKTRNLTETARALGVHRETLRLFLKKEAAKHHERKK